MYYEKVQADNNSIYAPLNKYGYRINITHPKILPLYEAYKKRKRAVILSDNERLEFEGIIFEMIKRKEKAGEGIGTD